MFCYTLPTQSHFLYYVCRCTVYVKVSEPCHMCWGLKYIQTLRCTVTM